MNLKKRSLSSKSDTGAKEMAELLRSGAKMLSYSCPQCGSPLFQLKTSEIWCAKCKRRVIIVPETEDVSTAEKKQILWETLEQNLMEKISSLNKMLYEESDLSRVKEISEVLTSLLSSIEKLRNIKT